MNRSEITLAIKNCRLVLPSEIVDGATVLLAGEKIFSFGKAAEVVIPSGVEVIEIGKSTRLNSSHAT